MTLVKRPLTEREMATIKDGIDAAGTPVEALESGVITLFDTLMADVGKCFRTEPTIDGQDYAIPDSQWKQVCEWLLERGRALDPIGNTNLGLTFMNVGPSSYAAVTS